MNSENYIISIVTRANKICLPEASLETVAVSIFINDKNNFCQVWLSLWQEKGSLVSSLDKTVFEDSSLSGALRKLDDWVRAMEDCAHCKFQPLSVTRNDDLFLHNDGDRIADEIGFGD